MPCWGMRRGRAASQGMIWYVPLRLSAWTGCRFVFQATAHAAKLFKEVDVDGDGELVEEEFIAGCKRDKVLMDKLQRIVDQCMGKQ